MQPLSIPTRFALLVSSLFVGVASSLAGEPPAGMLICVNANPVAPYAAVEIQVGVKAEWPSLNIAPFSTGRETFEQISKVSATYQPADTDLDSDESEATVEAGGNTLVVDFESGRPGKIRSRLLDLAGPELALGETVYSATLDLAEESIRVQASALDEDGLIEMSCVAILN